MATIDLTLDSFKVPAIENYTPPFGTKIVKTDANKGGLSTVEVNSNIMMPFANMRPKVITENSSTTEIEYDAKLCFSASLLAGATLELDDGAYEGCRLQITNLSSFACDVEYNSAMLVSIPTGANVEVLWTGSSWMLSTTGTVASGNVMAPTSAAVQAAIGNIKDYVDVSNSYSTEETLTGGTWVDEKPIYRKCWAGLTFGSTSNSWTNTGATIQDVDEVIHCVGLIKASGEIGTMMMSFRVNSNNNIQYNSPNTWGTTPKALILEYTKTTDPIP